MAAIWRPAIFSIKEPATSSISRSYLASTIEAAICRAAEGCRSQQCAPGCVPSRRRISRYWREVGRQVLLLPVSRMGQWTGWYVRQICLPIGVIQAATELGIRVPDELMVVGYDDDHFASESSIPSPRVSLPGHVGWVSWPSSCSSRKFEHGPDHVHRTIMLDPHLIPRRSTSRSPL